MLGRHADAPLVGEGLGNAARLVEHGVAVFAGQDRQAPFLGGARGLVHGLSPEIQVPILVAVLEAWIPPVDPVQHLAGVLDVLADVDAQAAGVDHVRHAVIRITGLDNSAG
ncbi:hypothetical protein D9M70_444030 [compost metagenome]